MRIAEPVTTLSDFALSLFLIVLAAMLIAAQGPSLLWAAAFLASSSAALIGGISHGFGASLPLRNAALLWRAALLGAAMTNYLLLSAVTRDHADPVVASPLLLLNSVKAIVVGVLLLRRAEYRIVIYDSALTIALVLLVEVFRLPGHSALWMVAGAALATIAAIIQRTGFRRGHPWNHNDLYHVAQAIAFYAIFRGAVS